MRNAILGNDLLGGSKGFLAARARAQSTHAITKIHASAEWIKIRERRVEKIDLVTRKTIVRKKYLLVTKNTSGWKPLVSHAWTTWRMRKVGSSRSWLFHIFQLRAPIFSLPVGEFFSNFWWQLRSIRCVYIPIFKKFCRWEKNLKSNSRKLGSFFSSVLQNFFLSYIFWRSFLNTCNIGVWEDFTDPFP